MSALPRPPARPLAEVVARRRVAFGALVSLSACGGEAVHDARAPDAATSAPAAPRPARTDRAPTAAPTAAPAAPRTPTAPPKPVRVVADDVRACAVFDDGALQCWGGFNFHGEAGAGDKKRVDTPRRVLDLRGVVRVALGRDRTCAATGAGKVFCWGRALGTVTDESILRPAEVAGITAATDVVLGEGHACALDAKGGVACWGANDAGQLGLGQDVAPTARPTPVPNLPPIAGIVALRRSTVAWSTSGELYLWGTEGDDRGPWRFAEAHRVVGLTGVAFARASDQQVCAVLADTQVRCFTHETLVAFEAGREEDFGPAFAALAAAFSRGRKVSTKPPRHWVGGTVFPDGRGLTGVVDIAVFNHDVSALTKSGDVYSWGNPERGTIAHPEGTKGFLPPTHIDGVVGAVALAGGFLHRCVLDGAGAVACFGEGKAGRLGTAEGRDAVRPVPVRGLPRVVSLAANSYCTFAIGDDDQLYTWGSSWVSACGIEDTEHPTPGPVLVPLVR